ncbi:hypothetical protein [Umezawaea sp.]|uniref:hypothetical protein n=1 Tax=Umezawaea sp. TaxID=1955258 RepID=UPI002ED40F15
MRALGNRGLLAADAALVPGVGIDDAQAVAYGGSAGRNIGERFRSVVCPGDLAMPVGRGGQDNTRSEFEALSNANGCTAAHIVAPPPSGLCLIKAAVS